MSKNIIIGQYIPRKSIIHDLDARTKIIIIFVFMAMTLIANSIVEYSIITMIVLLALISSKISIIFFIRSFKPIFIILLFTFLYHILNVHRGIIILSIWGNHLYKEGIISAASICGRIILLMLIASLLTLTTKSLEIARGFEKILNPLKGLNVPVSQISLMISIMLRFIPTILKETDKIIESQIARGANFRSKNMIKRILNYSSIIVPLLVTSVERADNLILSIESRAYGDGTNRTSFNETRYKYIDYIFFLITLITFSVLLFFHYSS